MKKNVVGQDKQLGYVTLIVSYISDQLFNDCTDHIEDCTIQAADRIIKNNEDGSGFITCSASGILILRML